jgi:general secretion pathway protein D
MSLFSNSISRTALMLMLGGALSAQAQWGQQQSSRNRNTSTRTYPNNSSVGDAIISVDSETRNLIVIADDDTAAEVAKVIQNLDRPQPQVLIKVVFLEVQHNNSRDLGIEGGWAKNMGNSTTGAVANAFGMSSVANAVGTNNPVNVFGQPTGGFGAVPPGAGLYQIFSQDYQVTLRAIAQAGKARVLSRPSIVARNNQPATITVGQSVPLITNVRFDTFGNAINSVSYTSVGIILRVTPFITESGLVQMIVSPETSELVADRSQWVPISSGSSGAASAPLINSRSADTVVVTPDGQTVIIGGLMQNSKAESSSKIPFLGDIPLLGNLFKRQSKNDSSTELLIFLTPTIIEAPADMTAVSEKEKDKADVQKNFSEQELNKFLDQVPPAKNPEEPKEKSKKRK